MLNRAVLWICIGLFFARVVGQIEVLLVAPNWLPAMQAWYSGLLPYPLLLPIQIALLMLMCVLAIGTRTAPRLRGAADRTAAILRALAIVYVVVMVVRLILISASLWRGFLSARRNPGCVSLGAGAVYSGLDAVDIRPLTVSRGP